MDILLLIKSRTN